VLWDTLRTSSPSLGTRDGPVLHGAHADRFSLLPPCSSSLRTLIRANATIPPADPLKPAPSLFDPANHAFLTYGPQDELAQKENASSGQNPLRALPKRAPISRRPRGASHGKSPLSPGRAAKIETRWASAEILRRLLGSSFGAYIRGSPGSAMEPSQFLALTGHTPSSFRYLPNSDSIAALPARARIPPHGTASRKTTAGSRPLLILSHHLVADSKHA